MMIQQACCVGTKADSFCRVMDRRGESADVAPREDSGWRWMLGDRRARRDVSSAH